MAKSKGDGLSSFGSELKRQWRIDVRHITEQHPEWAKNIDFNAPQGALEMVMPKLFEAMGFHYDPRRPAPTINAYFGKYKHFPIFLSIFNRQDWVNDFNYSVLKRGHRARIKSILLADAITRQNQKDFLKGYLEETPENEPFNIFLTKAGTAYLWTVTGYFVLSVLAKSQKLETRGLEEHYRQSLFLEPATRRDALPPNKTTPKPVATKFIARDAAKNFIVKNGLGPIHKDVMRAVEQIAHKRHDEEKTTVFAFRDVVKHMNRTKADGTEQYLATASAFMDLLQMQYLASDGRTYLFIIVVGAEANFTAPEGGREEAAAILEQLTYQLSDPTFNMMRSQNYFWVSKKVWRLGSLSRAIKFKIAERFCRTRDHAKNIIKAEHTIILETLLNDTGLPELQTKHAGRTVQDIANAFCYLQKNDGFIEALRIEQEGVLNRAAILAMDKHNEPTISLPVTGLKNPVKNQGKIKFVFRLTEGAIRELQGGLYHEALTQTPAKIEKPKKTKLQNNADQ